MNFKNPELFQCGSLSEFQTTVESFATKIPRKTVVLLEGNLGVGKTEFVKAFCRFYKTSTVTSPTFAIHQHYQGSNQGKTGASESVLIEHLDLYRMKNEHELDGVGFWDFFEDSHYVLIEWPSLFNWDQLPLNWQVCLVKIEARADQSRQIQIQWRVD